MTEESTAAPRSSPSRSREREKGATAFTDADVHVFFWFPLLAGLSELTFDPRPEIRRSALEVLFDTLKFHGENFSPGFWARVYDSILLPIFDHVRAGEKHAPEGDASPSNPDQPEADAWLYQTCQHCLELVVDLTAHFYPAVVSVPEVFPRLLALLEGLAARPPRPSPRAASALSVVCCSPRGISSTNARGDSPSAPSPGRCDALFRISPRSPTSRPATRAAARWGWTLARRCGRCGGARRVG